MRAETAACRPPDAIPPRFLMNFQRLLVDLVDTCRRNALSVTVAGALLAIFSGWYAAGHLGITTDTDEMFAASLPWRQRAEMFKKLFPQFQDLLVAVIDAKEPEEAEETAAELAAALSGDRAHFLTVRRPDASPFLKREGLLFLETSQLEPLIERMIDAQPFLGELAKDPSARGLFGALSLLGTGVENGQVNLAPYRTALAGFDEAMASALAGYPRPLSWVRLLGGELAELGGRYKFVLVQPRLDHTALQPGGAATQAIRDAANGLEFVKAGDARVRITGNVALADEEFASVAEGTVAGLIGSIFLITLWLFLAVRSWRLIAPILMTLGLGLMLTLLFAAAAVGTLNLVSVGFRHSVRRDRCRFRHPVFRSLSRDAVRLSTAGRGSGRNRKASWRTDLGRGRRHGGRFFGLRADGLSRRRGTRADRRGGNADRIFLHPDFPTRGDHHLSATWRARGNRLLLGGGCGSGYAPSSSAGASLVRDFGSARAHPAASDRL